MIISKIDSKYLYAESSTKCFRGKLKFVFDFTLEKFLRILFFNSGFFIENTVEPCINTGVGNFLKL